jgi:hypothetical protein
MSLYNHSEVFDPEMGDISPILFELKTGQKLTGKLLTSWD